MKPTRSTRRNGIFWITTAIALLTLGIYLGLRKPKPEPGSSEKSPAVSPVPPAALAPTAVSRGQQPDLPNDDDTKAPMTDLAAVYSSLDFTHVPDWMPRPNEAISVSAEDASLRSDGLREGTIRYTLASGMAETGEWLRQALAAAGLEATESGTSYASESRYRRCEVETEQLSPEQTRITLHYRSTDHSDACPCSICHETAPDSK